MLADWMLRLRSLFKRATVEKELEDELALHYELLVESHLRRGATREEAVRRARLEFGTLDLAKEEHRDARCDVCLLAAIGLAIGVPIALGASRLIESFLFETKPNDPRAIVAAVTILLTAALAAGYAPARRASRVHPMIALRHD
jgi:hypothetical protein